MRGPSNVFQNPKPWNFGLGVFPRTAPGGGEPRIEDAVRHPARHRRLRDARSRVSANRLRALARDTYCCSHAAAR
ncbi:MAG: hypothetical protein R3F17_06850 [Planctomycetota bacterium]